MAFRRPSSLLIPALLIPLLICSCAYHTTSRGRTLSGTVAVPFLENLTGQPDLEVLATEAISDALDRDGQLEVIPTGNEEFLLQGNVVRYSEAPFSISQQGTAEEYKLSIILSLSFTNLLTGEEIFKEKRFTGSANFYLEGSAAGSDLTQEKALESALEQIVEDILNAIFGQW